MLGGLNDSPLHAKTLARLIRDLPCHINLIPYHPHSGGRFNNGVSNNDGNNTHNSSGNTHGNSNNTHGNNSKNTTAIIPSSRKAIETFQNHLTEKNIGCTLRTSRGQDIDAACGLLATSINHLDL
jgi:23S rRNA (adenine2503-C2)-methyltransferase